jgi:hypothetical protein
MSLLRISAASTIPAPPMWSTESSPTFGMAIHTSYARNIYRKELDQLAVVANESAAK